MVDPNDFIITRKRKKYKFAKFANAKNCYEFDEWQKQPVDVLEIGAGTGAFSVEMAASYPEKTFVALDIKGDRLQHGAYDALKRDIENIQFVRARADQLNEVFLAKSVESIWLTFPDPFPKKRSEGRRMTHPRFLELFAACLRPGGSLCIKHDDILFFQWSLEQLVASGWAIKELSFDLHESNLCYNYKRVTAYERRWMNEGSKINFVRATYL